MSAYSEAVKALPNLGLFWPLNSATGAEDASGNENDGTGAGGITIGGHADSPIAEETHSTDFDGSDDHITSSYEPFSNGTTRTVGGWFWSDINTRRQDLWTTNASNVVYMPRIHSGTGGDTNVAGGLHFSPDWNSTDTNWAEVVTTGAWHFLVISFNESTNAVTAYINGEALEAKTNAGQYTAGKKFQVGRSAAGFSEEFDGKMAGVFVLEGGITAEQVGGLLEAAENGNGPPVGTRAMLGVGR